MTTSEIQTMDPSKMVDTTGSEQASNVFEGLNRLNKAGKVVSGVATTVVPNKCFNVFLIFISPISQKN